MFSPSEHQRLWQLYNELYRVHDNDDDKSPKQSSQAVIGRVGASFIQTGKDYALLYGRVENESK
jgi:hypothetical protein